MSPSGSEFPVILAEDKVIMVGDIFDELSGIVAKDSYGEEITDRIEVIENIVYTSKIGVYKVVYKVTDIKGISTTKEIRVTVTEKIDGIVIEEGNGTELNPVVVLLQSEKAIYELVNKLDNSFEYSIIDEPIEESDYKIYTIRINNKNNENSSYIELKAHINNKSRIDKLDNILIKDDEDSNEGDIISPLPPIVSTPPV